MNMTLPYDSNPLVFLFQMTPNYATETMTETMTAELGGRKRESSRTVTTQLWQKSGSCPKGTVPVLNPKDRPIQIKFISSTSKSPVMHPIYSNFFSFLTNFKGS